MLHNDTHKWFYSVTPGNDSDISITHHSMVNANNFPIVNKCGQRVLYRNYINRSVAGFPVFVTSSTGLLRDLNIMSKQT